MKTFFLVIFYFTLLAISAHATNDTVKTKRSHLSILLLAGKDFTKIKHIPEKYYEGSYDDYSAPLVDPSNYNNPQNTKNSPVYQFALEYAFVSKIGLGVRFMYVQRSFELLMKVRYSSKYQSYYFRELWKLNYVFYSLPIYVNFKYDINRFSVKGALGVTTTLHKSVNYVSYWSGMNSDLIPPNKYDYGMFTDIAVDCRIWKGFIASASFSFSPVLYAKYKEYDNNFYTSLGFGYQF